MLCIGPCGRAVSDTEVATLLSCECRHPLPLLRAQPSFACFVRWWVSVVGLCGGSLLLVRYLTYKVNFNALLLFELQNLVKEAQIMEAVRLGFD